MRLPRHTIARRDPLRPPRTALPLPATLRQPGRSASQQTLHRLARNPAQATIRRRGRCPVLATIRLPGRTGIPRTILRAARNRLRATTRRPGRNPVPATTNPPIGLRPTTPRITQVRSIINRAQMPPRAPAAGARLTGITRTARRRAVQEISPARQVLTTPGIRLARRTRRDPQDRGIRKRAEGEVSGCLPARRIEIQTDPRSM